jgi:hypothetical protein
MIPIFIEKSCSKTLAIFLGMFMLSFTSTDKQGTIKIHYTGEIPQVVFAMDHIKEAFSSKGIKMLALHEDEEAALTVNMIIDPELGFEAYWTDQKAVAFWEQYAETANKQYLPQLYARTQELNWDALLDDVKKDVDIARDAKPGESIEIIHDNILWEIKSRIY